MEHVKSQQLQEWQLDQISDQRYDLDAVPDALVDFSSYRQYFGHMTAAAPSNNQRTEVLKAGL